MSPITNFRAMNQIGSNQSVFAGTISSMETQRNIDTTLKVMYNLEGANLEGKKPCQSCNPQKFFIRALRELDTMEMSELVP